MIQKRGATFLILDPATLTEKVAEILEDTMGGTIGACESELSHPFPLPQPHSHPSVWNLPQRVFSCITKHTFRL